MSRYYDEFVQPGADPDTFFYAYNGDTGYSSQFGDYISQDITEDTYNDLTPKLDQGVCQAESEPHGAPVHNGRLPGYHYDVAMSTPPLSPSTTISSLHTDEYSSLYRIQSQESLAREEIRRGKQPVVPPPEELDVENVESDWYGMEYAVEQSRMDRPDSDAAFLAMYWGYVETQDIEYWYAHWCKWHRALAREEKRRRDRAVSDAEYTRAYQHAEYVQWERAQRKKYMQHAPGHIGLKPMKSHRNRHRASTCLF